MSKKNYLLAALGLVVIVIIIVAVSLFMKSRPASNNLAVKPSSEMNNLPSGTSNIPATPSAYTPKTDTIQPTMQTIIATANNFTPREVSAQVSSKISLVFSATDDATHHVIFDDQALGYINFTFSKAGGDKTITFPAPKAGTYSFHIDDQNNKGSLIVK